MNTLRIKKSAGLVKRLLIGTDENMNHHNVDRVIIFERKTGRELLVLTWDDFQTEKLEVISLQFKGKLVKKRTKDFELDVFAFNAEKAFEYSITGANVDIWIAQDIANFEPEQVSKSFRGVEVYYKSQELKAVKAKTILEDPTAYDTRAYKIRRKIEEIGTSNLTEIIKKLKELLKEANSLSKIIKYEIEEYKKGSEVLMANKQQVLEDYKL